jgi:hypothetical protein
MLHIYDKYHIFYCFINFYTTFEYQLSCFIVHNGLKHHTKHDYFDIF